MSDNDILLIGNGPSALSKPMGYEIDSFNGTVVRFNHYMTAGITKFVGSRTDAWVCVSLFLNRIQYPYRQVYYVKVSDEIEGEAEKIQNALEFKSPVTVIDHKWKALCCARMGYGWASAGAIATEYFLRNGYNVYLYGFDFMQPNRAHHYGDAGQRGPWHSPEYELNYFLQVLETGKVKFFHHDPKTEMASIVRQPAECGSDLAKQFEWGRTATQNGWYEWIAKREAGKSILDIGAGLGVGMQVMLDNGAASVAGYERDFRLLALKVPNLTIAADMPFKPKSYDVVTCIDVIEHVVQDKILFEKLCLFARDRVYITSPNFMRSRAGTDTHCREYTIQEFTNLFRPTEMWSGAPDGKTHHTRLLRLEGDHYLDFSDQGPWNKNEAGEILSWPVGQIPVQLSFNKTVDKMEWPCFCAIFDLQK